MIVIDLTNSDDEGGGGGDDKNLKPAIAFSTAHSQSPAAPKIKAGQEFVEAYTSPHSSNVL
jgi:hypothetical protein